MDHTPKFVDHDLIEQIERYLAERDMTVTEFGLLAVNDRRLVPDLREGRELRRSTRERIVTFISSPRSDQARAS